MPYLWMLATIAGVSYFSAMVMHSVRGLVAAGLLLFYFFVFLQTRIVVNFPVILPASGSELLQRLRQFHGLESAPHD